MGQRPGREAGLPVEGPPPVPPPGPARRDARNMARDGRTPFYDIVAEQGAMEQAQARDHVKKLMTKGRYSLDVWS